MARGWGTRDTASLLRVLEAVGHAMNRAPTVIAPKKAVLELNAIFENATVGILFTHNRKLMQANRLCAEMFGYTLDEFLGQPALILYENPEAYSALGHVAGPVLSRGESFKRRNPAQATRRQPVLVPRFGQGHRSRLSERRHAVVHRGHHGRPLDAGGAGAAPANSRRSRFRLAGHRGGAQPRLRALQPAPSRKCSACPQGRWGQATRRLFNSDEEFQRIGAQDLAPSSRPAPASARTDIPAPRRHGTPGMRVSGSPSIRPIRRPGRSGWPRTSRPRMKPRSARGRPSTSSR
jgi:PAS domain-containing protein